MVYAARSSVLLRNVMSKSTADHFETLRLFCGIACPLLPAIADELQLLQAASEVAGSGLRVVKPENLHLTLHFLGACRATAVPAIADALAAACEGLPPFTLTARGAGCFHGALWLGVQPDTTLSQLAARLQERLATLGFAGDGRHWQPHITLARLNHNPRFDWKSWQRQRRDTHFGSLTVHEALLYRSATLADGAHYTVLQRAMLG